MMIWTIGHSTRSQEEFLTALRSQQIEAVADVRKLPGSRKYPQFDQDTLAASLHAEDVAYHHFPDLGGRRKPRPDSRNTVWRHPAFRAYADYMETPEFGGAIERLTRLANEKRTALMCAEAVWWRCHRSLIADFLKVRGRSVMHILDARKTQEHPFTSAARLVDNELTYEPPGPESPNPDL
jgi:uncharacterized protein (DUF488 family)